MVSIILSGSFALYVLCAHNLCAPAVIPSPVINSTNTAAMQSNKNNIHAVTYVVFTQTNASVRVWGK